MRKTCLLLTLLLSGFCLLAQCKLEFVKPDISAGKFRITLKMSSTIPFSLGPNNLRFNYPTENLDNPIIISDNFPAEIFGETTLVGSNRQTGVVSVNTAYHGQTAAGNLNINKDGKELVTIEFDIVKPAEGITLSWRLDKHPKTAIVSDDKMIITAGEAKPLTLNIP